MKPDHRSSELVTMSKTSSEENVKSGLRLLPHNPDRRASEGMITRDVLPPIINSGSVNSLSTSLSAMSLTPSVTVLVNDDDVERRNTPPQLHRRSSSPWSKCSSSLSCCSNQFLAPSPPPGGPNAAFAPSPPPMGSPSNFQGRKRRLRRGSLPQNLLSSSSLGKEKIPPAPLGQRQAQFRNHFHQNLNVFDSTASHSPSLMRRRSLSPYPSSCLPCQHGPDGRHLRRASEGNLPIPARFRASSPSEKHDDRVHVAERSSPKETQSKIAHDKPARQNGHHQKSEDNNNNRKTSTPPKRPSLPIDVDRTFVPISNDEDDDDDDVDSDSDSLNYDFDDEEFDEAREWIMNWLHDVEDSKTTTAAVALDDVCQYKDSKETAIKVCYSYEP